MLGYVHSQSSLVHLSVAESYTSNCTSSISAVKSFLYETTRPEEWDGTVTLEVGKKGTKTYDLKTPEHLWNIVQILSKD